jgi:hypothetical protein
MVDDYIDRIIAKNNWEYEKIHSSYNHKGHAEYEYKHPDILITDSEDKTPGNESVFDELGSYINKSLDEICFGNLSTTKALIILRRQSILYYIIDNKPKITIDDYDNIMLIILVHELSHWLVYKVSGRLTSDMEHLFRWEFHSTNQKQNKFFHEGLAQYFTLKYLEDKDDERLLTLFKKLNTKQPEPYTKYKEIIEYPIGKIMDSIEYCRIKNKQDWEFFKDALDNINKKGLNFIYEDEDYKELRKKIAIEKFKL